MRCASMIGKAEFGRGNEARKMGELDESESDKLTELTWLPGI
jgi:hypothetical protein